MSMWTANRESDDMSSATDHNKYRETVATNEYNKEIFLGNNQMNGRYGLEFATQMLKQMG